MQIAAVGIERGELVASRSNDFGMAMPDVTHVVDTCDSQQGQTFAKNARA
jgi:hypothetical protein